MKDLYAQLGIDRTANAEEIAASARQRPDLEDSASILLDAGRRAVYDRAYANLKLIGELRRRLNLDAQDSWFARNHADFAARTAAPAAAAPAAQPAPATPQSAPAKPRQEPAARAEAARGAPHPNRTLSARLVLTIAVAIGVLAAIAYFLIPR